MATIFPIGITPIGPFSVPDANSGGTFFLTASANPALTVDLSVDLSLDGGVTWASQNPGPSFDPYPIGASFIGGSLDKKGNPVVNFDLAAPIPLGTGRQVRGTVTVGGVPFSTTASFVPT